jgi:hypothetical protein
MKLTTDEIIRMAVKCQLITAANREGVYMQALERFAALVSEATKEKMKKVFAVATPKSTWTTDRIIAEIEDMK